MRGRAGSDETSGMAEGVIADDGGSNGEGGEEEEEGDDKARDGRAMGQVDVVDATAAASRTVAHVCWLTRATWVYLYTCARGDSRAESWYEP